MTFSPLLAVSHRERMMVDLANRIDELEKWQDGCGLILQGADHTFCVFSNDDTVLKTLVQDTIDLFKKTL